MNMKEIIQLLTLVVTFLGFLIVLYKLRHTEKQNHANYIIDLIKMFNGDEKILNIFYDIDWGRFKYNKLKAHSPQEIALDRLLSFFETLCMLYKRKLIKKSDLCFFEYELRRVYTNKEVQKYLNWIKSVASNVESKPFSIIEDVYRNVFGNYV